MNICHTTSGILPPHDKPFGSRSRNLSIHKKSRNIACINVTSYTRSPEKSCNEQYVPIDGEPVVFLNIYKAPIQPANVPVFYEEEEITGSVELNLTKAKSIEEVTVLVRTIQPDRFNTFSL